MAWLKRAWAAVSDVIWPSRLQCLTCDEMSEGAYLCDACAAELNNLRLQEEAGPIRSAFPYRGLARNLVHALKFTPLADAVTVLAQAMAEEAGKMCLPPDTVLTWVTMPAIRRRERGIDHGRLLCDELGKRLGMPVKPLLVRIRKTHTQRGLSAAQRAQNLIGAFACQEKLSTPVLLIDDVLTTGATTRVCSQALLDAGATAVFVLTACRVEKREDYDEI